MTDVRVLVDAFGRVRDVVHEVVDGLTSDELAYPFDPADIGYGHTADEVAAVRVASPDQLIGYHDAVHDRTVAYVRELTGDDLARVVDEAWDPPVTVAVRLVSVVSDDLQHVGQAAFVRASSAGVDDRRITAMSMVSCPGTVRRKALAAGADAWLDGLPALVADLEREWSITVGRVYEDATEAFVAAAVTADGIPAVLKLLVPRAGDAAANEITVLRLADGDGCVRLLRHDEHRSALLLERLGRSLYELSLPTDRRHEILCSVASRVWRPAPDCGLPTGAAKGRWLVAYITSTWEALDHPCSERAVDHALACAARRIEAHNDERAVLVHGDVHQWNTLEADNGFKLVDPDGLLAEAEYDLGIIMREDPEDLMHGDPRDRARWLAARTGLDATAIWEWGVVERVSTGLLCATIDLQPVGRHMLAAADHIAHHEPDQPL